jgi:hypothetical protein
MGTADLGLLIATAGWRRIRAAAGVVCACSIHFLFFGLFGTRDSGTRSSTRVFCVFKASVERRFKTAVHRMTLARNGTARTATQSLARGIARERERERDGRAASRLYSWLSRQGENTECSMLSIESLDAMAEQG